MTDSVPFAKIKMQLVSSNEFELVTSERDMKCLSAAFLMVFMSFGASQNLESSVHKENDMGQTSLGLLYASFTIFCSIAPSVVLYLGDREAILFGLSGYWLFGAANLFPSWWSLYAASIYLGLSAAVTWVAQGSYLTEAAVRHARDAKVEEAASIVSFNGFFWSCFALHQVAGNAVALFICLLLEGGSSDTAHLSPATQNVLFLTLLLFMTVGTTLAFMLHSHGPGHDPVSTENEGMSLLPKLRSFAQLLKQPNMLLLLPTLLYSGFQQAFIWSTFTESVVAQTLGVAWIPGAMAVFGVSDMLASAAAGHYPRGRLLMKQLACFGMGCQACSLLALQFTGGGSTSLWMTAVLWGVGDAMLSTQISSFLPVLFPQSREVAFATWHTWKSAATAMCFFAGPHISLTLTMRALLLALFGAAVSIVFVSPPHEV